MKIQFFFNEYYNCLKYIYYNKKYVVDTYKRKLYEQCERLQYQKN